MEPESDGLSKVTVYLIFWAVVLILLILVFTQYFYGWGSVLLLLGIGLVVSLTVAFLLQRKFFAGELRFVTVVLCWGLALYLAPVTVADVEFYKAAGGVIPVLLLAMVVDKGREYSHAQNAGDRLTLIVAISALLAGGYVTFSALAENKAGGHFANIVTAAMIAGLATLTSSLVRRDSPVDDEAGSDHQAPCTCARPAYRYELGAE